MLRFQQHGAAVVKSITGRACGSSSTPQPFVLWRRCRHCAIISHGPWHHPGESLVNRREHAWRKSAYVSGVCFNWHFQVLRAIPLINWSDAGGGKTERGETLHWCRPLIKSINYKLNLKKTCAQEQRFSPRATTFPWSWGLWVVCFPNSNLSCFSVDRSNTCQKKLGL